MAFANGTLPGSEVGGLCKQNAAPNETFVQFKLVAFSSIHRYKDLMDFHGLHWSEVGGLCKRNAALKETFTRFQLAAISLISQISMDFRGQGLVAFANGMLPLKKLCSVPAGSRFIDFH